MKGPDLDAMAGIDPELRRFIIKFVAREDRLSSQ